LAEDIASEIVDDVKVFTSEKIRRPQIDEKMLDMLVDKIKSAKKPMILV